MKRLKQDVLDKSDLKERIRIKLKKDFQEKIWFLARDLSRGKINEVKWYNLGKIVKQSENSIKRFDTRKRAKPIAVYERLLKFLNEKNINFKWEDIEKNIIYIVKNKNKVKGEMCISALDLGKGELKPINLVIQKISWIELNKKQRKVFHLKDFVIRIKINNPYWKSKRDNHKNFKKIGRVYEIDFTRKVYIHLKDKARKELFDAFYKNIPGLSLRIRQKNACKLLNYYSTHRTLENMYRKHNQGIPLLVILKIIKRINKRKYNLNWIEKNLNGLSSGERTFYKIKFPIRWYTEEGILFLTSLLGDGGLGFRSSLLAWAVPHYAQFRHKELLDLYVRGINKLFRLKINKKERLELPAVCGYMVVASGYFIPGHKSYTDPSLPLIIQKNLKNLITSLNLLISDDGCFNVNHFRIAGGSYYAKDRPLKYMKQIGTLFSNKISMIKINYHKDKEGTYVLDIRGGFYAMKKLNNLFKKYNNGIFAKKKQKRSDNYLNNRFYSIKEYNKRYRRYVKL
jgi:hypothetical protein